MEWVTPGQSGLVIRPSPVRTPRANNNRRSLAAPPNLRGGCDAVAFYYLHPEIIRDPIEVQNVPCCGKKCIGTRQFKVCEGFLTCRRAHRHTGIAYWCTRPKAKAVPSPQRRRPSLAPATSESASPGTVEHLPARRPTRRTLSDRARPRSHSSEAVWPSQGCFLARTDQHAKPRARRQRGGLARGTDAWCPRGGITRQTKVRLWL